MKLYTKDNLLNMSDEEFEKHYRMVWDYERLVTKVNDVRKVKEVEDKQQ